MDDLPHPSLCTWRILLRYEFGIWLSTSFASSISMISWSVNDSCILGIVTCFGIVLFTETFKDGITYPFTTDTISWSWVNFSQVLLKWAYLPASFRSGFFLINKCFTKGWIFVRDSSEINSGNLLGKGASFWSTTLFTWDTTALMSCTLSLSQLFGFLP